MEDKRIFSIIIPTYNSEETIETALKSVLQQTFQYYEVLVIDNVSSDGTLSIVKKYAEMYPQIRWISEDDTGVYDAMNKGIRMAFGSWIYFLGSDDYLSEPTVLQTVGNIVLSSTHLQCVYGNVNSETYGEKYDGEFDFKKIIKKNIGHQAIFYRNTVFKKLGFFDLRYKVLADYAFNLKWFLNNSIQRRYIDIIVAVYAKDGISDRINDEAFAKDFNELVLRYGCKSLPIKTLLYFSRSKSQFLKSLIKRFFPVSI